MRGDDLGVSALPAACLVSSRTRYVVFFPVWIAVVEGPSQSPDEVLPGPEGGHPVVPPLALFDDAAVHPRHSDDIAFKHGGLFPPRPNEAAFAS